MEMEGGDLYLDLKRRMESKMRQRLKEDEVKQRDEEEREKKRRKLREHQEWLHQEEERERRRRSRSRETRKRRSRSRGMYRSSSHERRTHFRRRSRSEGRKRERSRSVEVRRSPEMRRPRSRERIYDSPPRMSRLDQVRKMRERMGREESPLKTFSLAGILKAEMDHKEKVQRETEKIKKSAILKDIAPLKSLFSKKSKESDSGKSKYNFSSSRLDEAFR